MLLENLQKQNVQIGSGTNFDTGEPVVFNPVTGKEVKPCKTSGTENTYAKSEPIHQKGCGIELVDGEETDFIKSAVKNSSKQINGKIRRDGKEIDARFFVDITVLYKGSNCGTIWKHGKEYYCCHGKCTAE
jgi:hypothetical protein